jgi:hypothetical protein
MGSTTKDGEKCLKITCVTVQIPAASISYIFSSFLSVSDGLNCDTESDHFSLHINSLKVAGCIRHGEAVLNIHDITQPKQLKTNMYFRRDISHAALKIMAFLCYLTCLKV